MAERRMFAKPIIDSDAFLEMSASAQCLYFHLCMNANNDGIINNALSILRSIELTQSDLDLLMDGGFIEFISYGKYRDAFTDTNTGIGELHKHRSSYKYRQWRQSVIDRDGGICTVCGRKKVLVAHHIVPFAKSERLRFEISNGITLCQTCHLKAHGGRWY